MNGQSAYARACRLMRDVLDEAIDPDSIHYDARPDQSFRRAVAMLYGMVDQIPLIVAEQRARRRKTLKFALYLHRAVIVRRFQKEWKR